jgi:hypothetical protein
MSATYCECGNTLEENCFLCEWCESPEPPYYKEDSNGTYHQLELHGAEAQLFAYPANGIMARNDEDFCVWATDQLHADAIALDVQLDWPEPRLEIYVDPLREDAA